MRTATRIVGLVLWLAASFASAASDKIISFDDLGGDAGSAIGDAQGYYAGFLWQTSLGKFDLLLGGDPGADRDAFTSFDGQGESRVQTNTFLRWAPRVDEPGAGGNPLFKFVSADLAFVPRQGSLSEASVTLKGYLEAADGSRRPVASVVFPFDVGPPVTVLPPVPGVPPGHSDFFGSSFNLLEIELDYKGSSVRPGGSWAAQFRLDNLRITPVPEPSTHALMAAGLLLVAWGAGRIRRG